MATRWLPRPLYSESAVDFEQFLGTLWEPKNHQKSICSPKSRPRECFFIDFCSERRFPRFFDGFLVDFGWKINEKKLVFFKPPSHFFQHGDPHETLYFTIRKLLFHFLSFWFFSKNWWKKWLKNSSAKKVEKWPPGDPKIDPKSWKNGRKIAKNPEKCQKSCFFEESIFWWFFRWPKNRKKKAFPSLTNQFSWPWAPLGDYRGKQPITNNSLSNTPLGRWPGELLIILLLIGFPSRVPY